MANGIFPHKPNHKILSPIATTDDSSQESTMDPSDVYIQEGDNRFMQVEGHPGTVAWNKAIKEATRKYNQSEFRDDHFRHVMKILAGADRDFYAGSLEYGWTKLNPIQIRTKCKEVYNKQVETDDEISSIFTEISHNRSKTSQHGGSSKQSRPRTGGAYKKIVDNDESIGTIFTGVGKGQSKSIRHDDITLGENSLIAGSITKSVELSKGNPAECGDEKKKRRGLFSRLINRKSTKDMNTATQESTRRSKPTVHRGVNGTGKYKQFFNGHRWVIESDVCQVKSNIIEEPQQAMILSPSQRIAYDMGIQRMLSRVRSTHSLVESVDIIKDLQEQESRKDNETVKDPMVNDVREPDEASQTFSRVRRPFRKARGSVIQSEVPAPEYTTMTDSRKNGRHLTSRRLIKGLGFKGLLSRVGSTQSYVMSASRSLQEVESRKDIETSTVPVERDVRETDEVIQDELAVLDGIVLSADTQDADDEAAEGPKDTDTPRADMDHLQRESLPNDFADVRQWVERNWNEMKEGCVFANTCLGMNECEDIEQVILEEHGSCCGEDDLPLPLSPYRYEFED